MRPVAACGLDPPRSSQPAAGAGLTAPVLCCSGAGSAGDMQATQTGGQTHKHLVVVHSCIAGVEGKCLTIAVLIKCNCLLNSCSCLTGVQQPPCKAAFRLDSLCSFLSSCNSNHGPWQHKYECNADGLEGQLTVAASSMDRCDGLEL